MKKLCLLVSGILAVSLAAGQAPSAPQVIPTSPSASSLQKYTDYPVSLNTGLVDIGVPIYTIDSHGIKVPIELKYHASGIRYDDASGNVGIGWSLFAGGMITGIQMGTMDFSSGFYNRSTGSINPYDDGTTVGYNDNRYLEDIAKEYRDSEYDMFNYSFLNYSGKFSFPVLSGSGPGSGPGTQAVLSPRRNFKISMNPTPASYMNQHAPITIVDEDGVTYKFGENLMTELPAFGDTKTANYSLTSITSADQTETIRFVYTGVSTIPPGTNQLFQRLIIDDYVRLYDHLIYYSSLPSNPTIVNGHHYYEGYTYNRLDTIVFKTGRVVFDHDANNLLTKVTVYNNTDTAPVKTAVLTQTLYGTDYYKLDRVDFQNSGSTSSYNYQFGYNGTPNARKSGFDYWGYYNGTSEPSCYVPNFQTDVDGVLTNVGTADREPNETAMQLGILNKVTYPTGGYSVFSYEAHRYYPSGNIAGGLRIKSIANYDASGTALGQKWYKYGESESGNGNLYSPINSADYCYTSLYAFATPTGGQLPTVFDYTQRERTFGAFPAYSNMGAGSSVSYTTVTEYTGDGTNDNGKTVYTYERFDDQFYGPHVNGPIPIVYRSNAWKTGNLLSKQSFKNISGSYTSVSLLQNSYVDLHAQDYQSLKVMRWLNWPYTSTPNANAKFHDQIIEEFAASTSNPVNKLLLMPGGFVSPYSYTDYLFSTGIRVLDNSVETTDGVSRTTSYTYDGTYDKVRTVSTTESDGSTHITQYTYPFDKTGTVYSGMVSANILSPVVQQDQYKNSLSTFLSSSFTDWNSWTGGFYKPQTVSTQKGASAAEVRLRYSAYDLSGNIKTVAQENGPPVTYIWSYNGAYPVAEVRNADYTAVETALGGSTAVTNFTNSNPSNSTLASFLAPLRTSLPNAQVTTYTYDPLVGQTSVTDAKGETTYYEYDTFQRLMNVKDKDGNITRHYEYHYKP